MPSVNRWARGPVGRGGVGGGGLRGEETDLGGWGGGSCGAGRQRAGASAVAGASHPGLSPRGGGDGLSDRRQSHVARASGRRRAGLARSGESRARRCLGDAPGAGAHRRPAGRPAAARLSTPPGSRAHASSDEAHFWLGGSLHRGDPKTALHGSAERRDLVFRRVHDENAELGCRVGGACCHGAPRGRGQPVKLSRGSLWKSKSS